MELTEKKSKAVATVGLAELQPSSENPSILVSVLGECDQLQWDSALLLGDEKMDDLRELVRSSHANGTESSYQLGLGLARLDGNKQLFEDLAVEYAVNLGVNPPTWIEQHGAPVGAAAQEDLVDVSSLSFESIIETTIKLESPWPVAISFAKATGGDEAGIELFNESLTSRIQRSLPTRIRQGGDFIDSLLDELRGGAVTSSSPRWNFAFTYLRFMGDAETYDALAAGLSKNGGEAPPYESIGDQASSAPEKKSNDEGRFPSGERLSSLNLEFAQRILNSPRVQEKGAKQAVIVVDCAKLRTGAISDMFHLSAFVNHLQKTGCELRLENVNEVVCVIMRALGVAALLSDGSNAALA